MFQRKLEVVEKAMAWYQEAIDTYLMLQMVFKAYDKENYELSMVRIRYFSLKALKLFEESSERLNPINLYYDFSKIENKYNANGCKEQINKICANIADIDNKINGTNTSEFSDEILKVLNEEKIDNDIKEYTNMLLEQIDSMRANLEYIEEIVFNGLLNYLDKADGNFKSTFICSVAADKNNFSKINLKYVEPEACFRMFKGRGHVELNNKIPVIPIVQMDKNGEITE